MAWYQTGTKSLYEPCWSCIINHDLCKTAVSPLLTHWRYCSLVLSHHYVFTDVKLTHMTAKCRHLTIYPFIEKFMVSLWYLLTGTNNRNLNLIVTHQLSVAFQVFSYLAKAKNNDEHASISAWWLHCINLLCCQSDLFIWSKETVIILFIIF